MSIGAVVDKEFRQIMRDRRTLGVTIFLPVFLVVMFGYAVTLDVRNAPLAVVDLDRTRVSRELADALSHNPEYFVVTSFPESVSDLEHLLVHGDVQAGIVIPRGFYREIISGDETAVQILVDGTNGTTASALQGYLVSVVSGFLRDSPPAIELRVRHWYNPELESGKYLVPGLVAFILVITAVFSTALSIVKEKELGTMEQLLASPLSPVELIVGKTVPYMVISLLIATGTFAAGFVLFGLGIAGSIFGLAVVTLLFLFSSLGLGILISSIADSQQAAFLVAILVTFLPAFILSGFIFPIGNMPAIIQAVTVVIPARYYIDAIRTIMLRGGGVGYYWKEALALLLFGLATVSVGAVRLKRYDSTI